MSTLSYIQSIRLFAHCIPVQGSSRSIICDLQRNTYDLIPNDLFNILIKYQHRNLQDIKSNYNNLYDEIIEEYFQFLEQKEYIFYSNRSHCFPDLDLQWDEPSVITNAIIDLHNTDIIDWNCLINELEYLGCKFLQIRCFEIIPLFFLDNILQKFNNKKVLSIEIFIKYQEIFNTDKLKELCETHPRVVRLYCHSAPKTEILHTSPNGLGNIYTIKNAITSNQHCGVINENYFNINIKTFTEAQKHNTCLNRKISIDTEGYIRNCPSMKEHYGNIKDTTLQEALEHPDFKKYWFINKDQISVCKDCEFRYICTDCRAYIENPEDMYSKPLKCGYNPYTCEWEEWSTNPLKQKAIDHYGMRELVKSE